MVINLTAQEPSYVFIDLTVKSISAQNVHNITL